MKPIKIQYAFPGEVTILSNQFIDQYMPLANGEFVKIYLLILRTVANETHMFHLTMIADTLSCTENDVVRALKYWEKVGLMKLDFDESNELSNVAFLPIHYASHHAMSASPVIDTPVVRPVVPTASAAFSEATVTQNEPVANVSATNETAYEESGSAQSAKKRSLSADKVKELKENVEIKQLLFITEQYLGKTLTPSEVSRILYFYDELHFSVDLIEYLIEYCVSKGSKSMRYIETVALAWDKEGITSVHKAKESAGQYSKKYYTIMKALGIKSRSPIEPEMKTMDIWLNDYGFTLDIITEACTRTIRQTNQPSLQYVDGILNRWKKKGIKHLADIDVLDEEHKKAAKASAASKQNTSSGNSNFNDFHQRTYDYNKLEKQLLEQ